VPPPLAADAGLATDGRGRIVTDAALRSVSHLEIYAVGDAAAVRQSYGVMHGTCPRETLRCARGRIDCAHTKRKQPKPFRFGHVRQPVSLGCHDTVIQFTHADDTPNRFRPTGRWATP
jgi:NADH:ubiquinone reductase (H+-translocating)